MMLFMFYKLNLFGFRQTNLYLIQWLSKDATYLLPPLCSSLCAFCVKPTLFSQSLWKYFHGLSKMIFFNCGKCHAKQWLSALDRNLIDALELK
jgi:hypothetical protein